VPDAGRARRVVHPYATRTSKDHSIAARVGKGGRDAPPPRHRGLTRKVRLRRTVLTLFLLVALGVAGWAGANRLADTGASGTSAAPASSSTASTSPDDATPSESDTSDASPTSPTTSEPAVPEKGNGEFTLLKVPGKDTSRSGRTVRYTVEIEGGLTGVDAQEFASEVRSVLRSERGWEPVDKVHFVNVSPAQYRRGADVDIQVTLTSPTTTDELCAPLQTNGQVSCWNGERSVINVRRWLLGADTYGDDVAQYRVYLLNHEIGHGLGHAHVECPGAGERAPIMLQQTLGLEGCTKWPYPKGG
jgi:hypothetical protein